jgi:hypothetical protein
MLEELRDYILKHKILIPIILFGFLVNYSILFPIVGNMGHDTFWHLSLINVAFKTFPFQTPIFAGASLQGYNYLSDFLMFLITKIGFSAVTAYFVITPLVYLVLITILVLHYGLKRNKSILFVAPLVFFFFLASPFSYILSLIQRHTLFDGFRFSTAMQSSTVLTNFPYALTLIVFMVSLIILQKKKISLKERLLLGVLVFISLGLKFYGGAVLLFMFFVNETLVLLERKKIIDFLINNFIYLLFFLLSVWVFYGFENTGGTFGFAPLALIHPLIEDPQAFYMPKLVLARYYLLEQNLFSPRLIGIELFNLVLYIVYNSGTRIVGLIYIIFRIIKRKITREEAVIFMTIIFSALLSFLLVQKGQWWNTVQFFGYSLFLLNFFAASFVCDLLKKKRIAAYMVVFFIGLLTLPLNLELLKLAAKRIGSPHEIVREEMEALDFLKKRKDGTVFTIPVMPETAYIPAFSHKPVLLADEHVLANMGVDYLKRKEEVVDIIKTQLLKINARYLYLLKDDSNYQLVVQKLNQNRSFKNIFENRKVVVYESLTLIDL